MVFTYPALRIISVQNVNAQIVEVANSDWGLYQRDANGCWSALMGHEWFAVDSAPLEQAYQQYQRAGQARAERQATFDAEVTDAE